MDFRLSDDQEAIREAISAICKRFGDDYWLKRDREGGFPQDFYSAFAEAGWLGICIPEEYGGSGLGITEAAIMMRAIAESGAGMSGAELSPHETKDMAPIGGKRLAAILAEMIAGGGNDHA